MGRLLRKKSTTGIYQVMVRGINKEPIFREEKDTRQYNNSENLHDILII
ncbi:hypothetical protein [Syntrophaceticus schinkii]|uniref:Uncharacterized protein n=1 Tax=Syntrophaceticus schinkii TaxID=499207 RepID=A0A0B7ME49_9FIRM|nr:hypothetical protein [Syntrophaceticus schinkii]MDD2359567.1 hypothetical protein [Syntrophaceticus schinkii]MDD4262666.1 hypothetical protein [Syntrophaceticus schinkii]CEO88340.1 hypothetical protein SSCH_1770002 [Syntrophaceticus schinkii]